VAAGVSQVCRRPVALCTARVDGDRRWEEGVPRAEHVSLMAAPPAALSEQQ